jgi:hypothetical protein
LLADHSEVDGKRPQCADGLNRSRGNWWQDVE